MRIAMVALVASLGLMAGCDDTLFGTPRGGPVEGTCETPTYTADFAGVQDMFDDHCTDCHPSLNPFLPAELEADVRSGAGVWIVSGDPEGSTFWRVISGGTADGDPPVMPLGSTGVPDCDRKHVEIWIADGAVLDGGEG